MPRLIAPGDGAAIELDDLVAALDAEPWDPRDEDVLASFGPLLARLARNPGFLADCAVAELERRGLGGNPGGYGAQALVLRPPNGRYLLRAAFWPALADAVTRASGASTFFYGHAHDHNFSFLTAGYLGPGYWTDHYERIGEPVGYPGERVDLRPLGRARLDPGAVWLYRAHRDVHVQHPPDAFSVSLNILAVDPGQPWRTQFRYDNRRRHDRGGAHDDSLRSAGCRGRASGGRARPSARDRDARAASELPHARYRADGTCLARW